MKRYTVCAIVAVVGLGIGLVANFPQIAVKLGLDRETLELRQMDGDTLCELLGFELVTLEPTYDVRKVKLELRDRAADFAVSRKQCTKMAELGSRKALADLTYNKEKSNAN